MLKRRIFAASLASVLALSSFSAAAFADDESKAYANKADLEKLVKKMNEFKDDDKAGLDTYGEISAEKFTKALEYAENVLSDAEATTDDYAVSYTMLKAAKDNLTIKTLDELKALLSTWKLTYDKANILNEDIGDGTEDYQYTEETYEEFDYAYAEAQSLVDFGSTDSKEITNAWEALDTAAGSLVEKEYVLKTDFAREIAKLQQAQKKEFDYHAWQRGTVEGTGTKYDDQTYAWSMLFYHIWSAFDNINGSYETIKSNKSLDRTTNTDIVNAYKGCQEAVAVLNGFKADGLKSYRNEDAVRDIINKTYKSKLLANDSFVQEILKDTIGANELVSFTKDDDTSNAIDPTSLTTYGSKNVKKNQITVYVVADDGVEITGGKIAAYSSGTKIEKGTAITLVGNSKLVDFIQVLGTLTTTAEPDKQENKIWDGNAQCANTKVLGDGSVLVKQKLANLEAIKMNGGNLDGWVTGGTNGPSAGTTGGTADSDHDEAVSKSDEITEVTLSPSIGGALQAINGGDAYDGTNALGEDVLEKKSASDKKTAEQTIVSSKAIDLDNLSEDKVSAAEWTAIGNYLEIALKEWLEAPAEEKYTVSQADKLIDDTDELVETTSQSAVFKVLNDTLVDARNTLLEDANANRRTKEKVVTTTAYKAVSDAKTKLEKAIKAFAYSYEEIYDYIAMVEKNVDDKNSAAFNNDNLKKLSEELAYKLLNASDLANTSDEDVENASVEEGEFRGYNRVYTNDGTFKITLDESEGEVEIAKSKGGANQSHYDLKTAYEALQTAYDALTSPTTTKGDVTQMARKMPRSRGASKGYCHKPALLKKCNAA